MSFVDRVRAGLAELRALDHQHTVFGAGTHRYELLPVVSPSAIEAMESEHAFISPTTTGGSCSRSGAAAQALRTASSPSG